MTDQKKPEKTDPNSFPPPPTWDRPVGAPEEVLDDVATPEAIFALDEHAFMEEVATRLNAFIADYPGEAQHILGKFLKYEYEMVSLSKKIQKRTGVTTRTPPGITVALLFAALLQTRHGNGYFLHPVLVPDVSAGEGYVRFVKFEVQRQEDIDFGPLS